MWTNRFSLATAALALQTPVLVSAQDYTERVWGVFAYTLYGDSTPNVLAQDGPRVLTEYGASQLAQAGSAFRDRYVSSDGNGSDAEFGIQNISPNILDSSEVDVFSTTNQYIVASAQAFMQGLYPPLGPSDITYSDTAQMANGSLATSPLGGYQYPPIVTLGQADPQSLIVAGQAECSMHQVAVSEYQDSSDALAITQQSEDFYAMLWSEALSGVWHESSATYTNAVDISDYLEYELLHNDSVLTEVYQEDIKRARWLADRYIYATNNQPSSSVLESSNIGAVNAIAGQTLASSILHAFDMNIQENGTQQKMTMLFGSDEPAVALASLMGLATSQQSDFYSRPVRGGSLVFELYSLGGDDVSATYPNADSLYVRFFLHNGTDAEFTLYPLFGNSPSQSYVPYSEFRSEIETFAVTSIQDWCLLCNSSSLFCTGVLDDGEPASQEKKRMAPAVAGVIGAVIALVAIGLLAVIGFLVCGCCKRGVRTPHVRGFKGTNKLASDTDVTFRNPSWGTSKTANAEQQEDASGATVPGHESFGSWEMDQQRNRTNMPPGENQTGSPFDDNEDEWQVHSGLQPVKARESV